MGQMMGEMMRVPRDDLRDEVSGEAKKAVEERENSGSRCEGEMSVALILILHRGVTDNKWRESRSDGCSFDHSQLGA